MPTHLGHSLISLKILQDLSKHAKLIYRRGLFISIFFYLLEKVAFVS